MGWYAFVALAFLLIGHGVASNTAKQSGIIDLNKVRRPILNSSSENLVDIYDNLAEYLSNFNMHADPCQDFNKFVCSSRPQNETLLEFDLKELLKGRVGGHQRDDLDQSFIHLYEYSQLALQNFKDAVNTTDKKRQYIATQLHQFQEMTGTHNSIFNTSVGTLDWTTDPELFGKVSAYLKRTLNTTFLFDVGVQNVHKPAQNSDIFIRQHFSSLFDSKSDVWNLDDKIKNNIEHLDNLLQTPNGFNANSLEYLGANARYPSVPFLTYFRSLITSFPTRKLDIFNFYFYVQDPDYLNKRIDIDQLKNAFNDTEFAEILHNYLTLTYLVNLEDFIERVVDKNEIDAMDLAISAVPELTRQIVIKSMYENRKMRAKALERFEDLTQRIKAEMKNLINRLQNLEDRERVQLIEKIDQTDPYFNGLFEDYTEQGARFRKITDLLPGENHNLTGLFQLYLDFQFNLSRQANGNKKHSVPLPIDIISAEQNTTISILTAFLNLDLPDEIWYAVVGPKIASTLWSHVSENDKNVQKMIEVQIKCFEDEYYEGQGGDFPDDPKIRSNKMTLLANEVMVTKTVYAALLSRISDYGQSPALNSSILVHLRPEQLLLTTMEIEKCEQKPDFYDKVYNLMKLEKLPEFSNTFQCLSKKQYEKCEILKFGRPADSTPHWSVRLPTPKSNHSTPALERLSQVIESRLNIQVDPCTNFYDYACTNMRKNTFQEIRLNNNEVIEQGLRKGVQLSDPKLVRFMKTIYQKCYNEGEFTDSAFNDVEVKVYIRSLMKAADLEELVWSPNKTEDSYVFRKKFFRAAGFLQRYGIVSFMKPEAMKIQNQPVAELTYDSQQKSLDRSEEDRLNYWKRLDSLGFSVPDVREAMESVDKFRAEIHKFSEVPLTEKTLMWLQKLVVNIKDFWLFLLEEELPENTKYNVASSSYLVFTKNDSQIQAGAFNTLIEDLLFHVFDETTTTNCVGLVDKASSASVARIIIDVRFPTETQQKVFKDKIDRYTESLKLAFRGMINQVDWMNQESKQQAFLKLDNMKHFAAFTPFFTDNDVMNEVSSKNKFSVTHPLKFKYHDNEVMRFRQAILREQEVIPVLAQMSDTNAFYLMPGNMMGILLGILNEPAYHPDYPVAAVFGTLGFILGHELVHGFDSSGINFDANGTLLDQPWIDEDGLAEYNRISDCLKEQYGQMCRTKEDGLEHCLDSTLTLGENIADNGGIRAAFRAYRNWVSVTGSDGRLPGPLTSQMSDDQLFFVRVAQLWCTSSRFIDHIQTTDNHSPSRARVNGVVANFPAFRDAFDCPAESRYARKQHCEVWADEIESHLIAAYD